MRSEQVYQDLTSGDYRVFVSEDGLAALTCPNCGLVRQVSVTEYRGRKQTLRVRCRCQQTFTASLEFRQSHRKPTDLRGFYEVLSETGGGRAQIKDLSCHGMGFMVSGVHNVRVGQRIQVNFALDDPKQTPLQKLGVVRSVHDNRIGCEFRKDQAFEKDLGFYLRS